MKAFKKIGLVSAVAFALFAFNACSDDSNSSNSRDNEDYSTDKEEYGTSSSSGMLNSSSSSEVSSSSSSKQDLGGKRISIVPGTDLIDSRNGKTYKTVVVENFFVDPLSIDSLIWMTENLNFETEQSHCYENKEENCTKYGRLYNWADAQKVCPEGWRLPYIKEWPREQSIHSDFVEDIASEFSITYGGLYADAEYDEMGVQSYYWTMEDWDKTALCTIFNADGSGGMHICNIDENYGLSVRCVKEVR